MNLPVHYPSIEQPERRLVREEYARLQEGKCCHCGEPLDGQPSEEVQAAHVHSRLFPPRFFDWPVHLHHDHDTGMTIGAVHARCNAVLWQYHGK